MKIANVIARKFTYRSRVIRDSEGRSHPGPEHDALQAMLRIVSDEGVEGYSFCPEAGAALDPIKRTLMNEDPFYRERIWQSLKQRQRHAPHLLSDRVIAAVDLALWDLAGRHFGQPVHRLLGASRDKVKAYASTMCGDDLEGGLDCPEAYARFAEQCIRRGYRAFKLHTWQPPMPGAPDPRRDASACRAVRERVGDGFPLMLDPFHFYSREDALFLGREIEKLGFYWFEEPMDENSTSSYVWLTNQLSIPIVGPETAGGKMQTRAEWIVRGASDISRGGVWDVGGITPLLKIAHLCEAFGVRLAVHLGGVGNLHVLGAMGIPGEWYERGLLHPFLDYDAPAPWLNEIVDPMDDEGFVHLPQGPGLGQSIDFAFIESNGVNGG